MKSDWILRKSEYISKQRPGMEPVFTVGNGFMCARGFFEEEQSGLEALGGIYMADVFGENDTKPWKGKGKELVNTPNIFYTSIKVDGEQVTFTEDSKDFDYALDMKKSLLLRSYTWKSSTGKKLKLTFERFISMDDKHISGQKIAIISEADMNLEVLMDIKVNVQNLNMVSCEPLPIQPGRTHMMTLDKSRDHVVSRVRTLDKKIISYTQKAVCHKNDDVIEASNDVYGYQIAVKEGDCVTIEKVVHTALSDEVTQVKKDYNDCLQAHIQAMEKKWHIADVKLSGSTEDQIALRYNILQLMQAYPYHTNELSVGARGLTGEMYEGCVFWDTEIFMLPFFQNCFPEEARGLLEYRYNTLDEARSHAKDNWFEGAMYGWQVDRDGIEQTPKGVGAYYSIHVVADIVYSMLSYWYNTGDLDFMLNKGLEILIETSRFWNSRMTLNENNQYQILAVRGPNEYDVIVNNNAYTNMMARENLKLTIDMINLFSGKEALKLLCEKLDFDHSEMDQWKEKMENLFIPFNESKNLYEEDDMYLQRKYVEMSKAKPTGKRVIDTTIPYEALMFYQLTKQADVLHLMKNLPWLFTKEQMNIAWDYYVPRTCHDSSLSYSMHSIMASKLGKKEEAYRFFDISANLDLRDVQLNTISGLHFANFGGTWQAAVYGFGGLEIHEDHLVINPSLPKEWTEMSYKVVYKNSLIHVEVGSDITVEVQHWHDTKEIEIEIMNKRYTFNKETSRRQIHEEI